MPRATGAPERPREHNPVRINPSAQGIEQARTAHSHLEFLPASACDPPREKIATFPLVVSLEVIEHVYYSPRFARPVFDVQSPEGILVCSTSYHGWLNNVLIALLGRFDNHVNLLRVYGHTKFWSRRALTWLLEETGFEVEEFGYIGRSPPLAKSMIAVVRRPESSRTAHLPVID